MDLSYHIMALRVFLIAKAEKRERPEKKTVILFVLGSVLIL